MAATLFLRTNLHPNSILEGQGYFGFLFFALIVALFDGFAEETLTVRPHRGFGAKGLLGLLSWWVRSGTPGCEASGFQNL